MSPLGPELIIGPTLLCIWQHIVRGENTADIARALFLSHKTVRNYLTELYSILGIVGHQYQARTQAAVLGWHMMGRFPALAVPVDRP